MAFIDFTNGEVLTADQMDTVMRQSVMRFADAAARDTALSAVLAEGMMCYLDDTNEVLKYDGSSWIDISGDITGVTAGTALTGGGTSGNVTLDVDETALTIAQSQVTDLTTDLAGKQDDVITTQGDLVIGDVSGNPVRLPVGTADQVLTSDGTTVSFQDASGGGGMTLISSGSLTGNSTTLSSIPGTYKNLVLWVYDYRSTNDNAEILVNFNGDSATNYNRTVDNFLENDGESAELIMGYNQADNQLDSFVKLEVFDYASTNHYKYSESSGFSRNTSDSNHLNFNRSYGGWRDNSAISSIRLFTNGNFASGNYELYGVS